MEFELDYLCILLVQNKVNFSPVFELNNCGREARIIAPTVAHLFSRLLNGFRQGVYKVDEHAGIVADEFLENSLIGDLEETIYPNLIEDGVTVFSLNEEYEFGRYLDKEDSKLKISKDILDETEQHKLSGVITNITGSLMGSYICLVNSDGEFNMLSTKKTKGRNYLIMGERINVTAIKNNKNIKTELEKILASFMDVEPPDYILLDISKV